MYLMFDLDNIDYACISKDKAKLMKKAKKDYGFETQKEFNEHESLLIIKVKEI